MASSARIEELRKKFEENPRRYFAPLANEYRKAGDIEQAIAICREYLPQQPGHMSGHIVYGQALYEARQVEEAKTVFETALSLDPENLIALRHLGDIALLVGDMAAAKTWYGRVLEADPLNEEIQAQLVAIEQSEAGAPTPAAAPSVEQSAAEPAKPTPSSAPTVVQAAYRPAAPTPVRGTPVQDATVEIPVGPDTSRVPTIEVKVGDLPPAPQQSANDTTLAFEPTSFVPPPEPAPTPTLELDSPVSSSDAPPLDSFNLEGLETTSLSEPPAASAPEATASFEEPPPPWQPTEATAPPAIELDLAPPPADEAPSADLPFVTEVPAAEAAEEPSSSPTADLPLLDIGEVPTAPMDGFAAEATQVPNIPEAVRVSSLTPNIPFTPIPVEPIADAIPAAAAPESGPFVTETMAELYLQQGHRDEALRVYRALLEQRPDDELLAHKVASLSAPAPSAAPAVFDGPTIREFLVAIATRRPGARAEPVTATNGNGATAPPPPAAEAAQSTMPDLLSALFGGAAIAAADEGAARALALAFVDLSGLEAGADDISGAPARHASNDLSLDSVFRSEASPPAAPSSFSFDQFFSQRATAEHAAAARANPTSAPENKDDVAQFNQWLEGLKQR